MRVDATAMVEAKYIPPTQIENVINYLNIGHAIIEPLTTRWWVPRLWKEAIRGHLRILKLCVKILEKEKNKCKR